MKTGTTANQITSSMPSTTGATAPKKHRASMARHRRKCAVCHHPNCQEIEEEYLRWRSPAAIALQYGLAGHATIYRHMHATGIFARRRNRLRLALDPLIEHVAEVNVTANAILRAVATCANLKDARKWLGRPGVRNSCGVNRFARPAIDTAIKDEAQRISNRETVKLEPDASR
jgi:hypothetical protein